MPCKHGFEVEGFDCPECETFSVVPTDQDKNIVITVRGGVVQDVEGLPEGWSYTLKDYDDDPDQDDEEHTVNLGQFDPMNNDDGRGQPIW